MSDKAKRYKTMYERKLITKEQLQKLMQKGIITQAEYDEIVND